MAEHNITFRYNRDKNGLPYFTRCDLLWREYGPEGSIRIGVGTAHCHEADKCRKEEGRKVALERAMNDIELTREQRSELWQNYHRRKLNTLVKS